MKIKRELVRIFRKYFILTILLALGSVTTAQSASLSGTVFDESGDSAITGENLYIIVYAGDQCTNLDEERSVLVNQSNGQYSVPGLSAGTYLLYAFVFSGNYLNEWWSNSLECSSAESITVAEGESVTDKHFQLNTGATVSGTIYEDDGTALTGMDIRIDVYGGDPCGDPVFSKKGKFNSANGTYIVEGIPTGDYYLRAAPEDDNYLLEWWISPLSPFSSPKCSYAISTHLTAGTTITEKDFHLNIALPGDVNRDGDVSLYDAIITLQTLTGQSSNRVWLSGDVNQDSRIGLPEAIYILKESSQYAALPGDVNRDGDVSLLDVIITLQNLTGQSSNRVWLSGDVNEDDRIGLPEAIYILKESAQ